ncbi:MAG TPA: hypothetical protein VGJ72_15360 [Polaromonas sp.]
MRVSQGVRQQIAHQPLEQHRIGPDNSSWQHMLAQGQPLLQREGRILQRQFINQPRQIHQHVFDYFTFCPFVGRSLTPS